MSFEISDLIKGRSEIWVIELTFSMVKMLMPQYLAFASNISMYILMLIYTHAYKRVHYICIYSNLIVHLGNICNYIF